MNDRVFFSALALLAAGLIALAMVWPQGYGARSPGPFGSTPIQQTPEMQAALKRERDGAARRRAQAEREAGQPDPTAAPPAVPDAPSMMPSLRPSQDTETPAAAPAPKP